MMMFDTDLLFWATLYFSAISSLWSASLSRLFTYVRVFDIYFHLLV